MICSHVKREVTIHPHGSFYCPLLTSTYAYICVYIDIFQTKCTIKSCTEMQSEYYFILACQFTLAFTWLQDQRFNKVTLIQVTHSEAGMMAAQRKQIHYGLREPHSESLSCPYSYPLPGCTATTTTKQKYQEHLKVKYT